MWDVEGQAIRSCRGYEDIFMPFLFLFSCGCSCGPAQPNSADQLDRHTARVNDVRYAPNQAVFVSGLRVGCDLIELERGIGSYDRTVCVWDNRSRNTQPIQSLKEATGSSFFLPWSGVYVRKFPCLSFTICTALRCNLHWEQTALLPWWLRLLRSFRGVWMAGFVPMTYEIAFSRLDFFFPLIILLS